MLFEVIQKGVGPALATGPPTAIEQREAMARLQHRKGFDAARVRAAATGQTQAPLQNRPEGGLQGHLGPSPDLGLAIETLGLAEDGIPVDHRNLVAIVRHQPAHRLAAGR